MFFASRRRAFLLPASPLSPRGSLSRALGVRAPAALAIPAASAMVAALVVPVATAFLLRRDVARFAPTAVAPAPTTATASAGGVAIVVRRSTGRFA
eukprot:CAMPEP_0172534388 /NCGR_PEP_ID=MMETSP1067-20121228/6771_1 /TAXON_ID=265564 ORGANISM="Thalassiosira punctigera, Strain Tpunct2005C2" /NCGR_SAMPLE_ID=MMETSP1067 /ASSEMBLY_ACC=CAM_ASM_000444 /LENGTH=95 /DNA_ID=CAMNT_0013319169 /DNA_START=97 /DNA_END=382 /DNA_ORIENTATION=+